MVLSRLSEAGGRGAGGFLGGIANNPGVIIIVAIIAGLVLFRGDIRQAFAGFGQIELPTIELPSFPDVKFPDITFPTFELPTFEFPDVKFPDITFPTIEFPTFELPSLPEIGDPFAAVTDFFANVFGQTPGVMDQDMAMPTDFTEVGMAAARARQGTDQEQDFVQVMQDTVSRLIPTAPTIVTEFPFIGGGPSFEGGQIFETPIANLSLSQIIDRFMVSATQAAGIRAEALGFTEAEQAFLMQGPEDVGGFIVGGLAAVTPGLGFEGLTPEEISLRLTGGNIQNFA